MENTLIQPGMSDEGLAVGAAPALDAELAIADAPRKAELEWTQHPGNVEVEIADRSADRKVVARFVRERLSFSNV